MAKTKLASRYLGDYGHPSSRYHVLVASVYSLSSDRYECVVREEWGSNQQGSPEEHGNHQFRGRGRTHEQAILEVTEDVLDHETEFSLAERRNLLRELAYDCQDLPVEEDSDA